MKKKLLTLMASIIVLSFLFTGCVNDSEENEKKNSNSPQTNNYEWQEPPARVRPDGNGGTIKEDADGNIIDIENADGTRG